jgi:hypothetical protein
MLRLHIALGVATTVAIALGAGCGSSPDNSLGTVNPYHGPSGSGSGSSTGSGTGSGSGSTTGSGTGTSTGTGTGSGSATGTGSGSGTGGATGAEAYFETMVYPAINASPDGGMTAACSACHASGAGGAPAFLAGADAAGAYATITGSMFISLVTIPANSLLVLHGAHTGPALNAAQTAIIDNWLGQEVTARHITAMPLKTVQSELMKVGACMQLSDFTADGPSVNGGTAKASDLGSDNDTAQFQGNPSPCNTCHSYGDGGFEANSDPATMLAQTQMDITYIKKWITGTVDQNGNFSGLVASNALEQQVDLTQVCMVQGDCHPKINLNLDLTTSATLAAVNQFVQATLTRYNMGSCP